jgi:hypothetical protein
MTLVIPGMILTLSQPKIRKNDQSRSNPTAARKRMPKDILGAHFFAANPAA